MTKFEEFKKVFEEKYEDICEFINDVEEAPPTNIPFQYELKEDLDEINHDSYGSEDSKLKRIFYLPEYEIYVQFEGTRQSYNGEEWNSMKQVAPAEKTIFYFKEI